MEPAPNAEKLDEYLKDVVQALHKTVSWGISHQGEPQLLDQAIRDCKEVLDTIMEGNVSEWLK